MTAIQTFDVNNLTQSMQGKSGEYLEFLHYPDTGNTGAESKALSSGIYHLTRDSIDPQLPHDQDEVYYVLEGKACFKSDIDTRPIEKGSIIFVASQAAHKFVDIEQDLTLLVFFSA